MGEGEGQREREKGELARGGAYHCSLVLGQRGAVHIQVDFRVGVPGQHACGCEQDGHVSDTRYGCRTVSRHDTAQCASYVMALK
jgi:hypothetical protein